MGIRARKISKVLGEPPTQILSDIDADIQDGEFVAVTGKSGSGKSTLLYLLSSLDTASDGTIEIEGHDVGRMDSQRLSRFRNTQMGFVFQFHYLLAELSALENVLMPARKAGREVERRPYAEGLLAQFELGNKLGRFPRQLSGGELQRVAIARALVMEPKYLFADEPTGSLDSANANRVMEIFRTINKTKKTTVLMVTHDPDFAQQADRQIHLSDGRLVAA